MEAERRAARRRRVLALEENILDLWLCGSVRVFCGEGWSFVAGVD